MRHASLLLLSLALAAPLALAEEPAAATTKPQTLTGFHCLEPGPSTGWTYLDDSNILIDGGNRKYKLEFTEACWGIKFDNSLAFRGDSFNGRVCGDLGDEVITEHMHCRIKHLEIISTDQYRQIIQDNKAAIAARKAERARAKESKAP